MKETRETSNEVPSIVARVQREIGSWPGVTMESYRGGMVFFHVGKREIGHLHGTRFADLPFPVRIREQLVAAGKAELHYLHPKSGWITCYIRDEKDVEVIIELFRLNYSRPWLNRTVSPLPDIV
jgi:luciferase-like monooxygenase